MTPILMTEEYWANTHFSVVRYSGQMHYGNIHYIIVNKDGKDIFECSIEAEKTGRDKAIEAGEPCDLIDSRFKSHYRRLGREGFMRELEAQPKMNAEEFLEYLKTVKNEELQNNI